MEMTKGPRSRLSSGDLPPEYETATMEEPTRLTPFDCADLYRARGWEGTIPLPASSKTPPPSGYTGAAGHMPSGADVEEWRRHGFRAGGRTYPAGNLALRLPRDVIGLDVDHYGTKSGGDTLAGLITRWGPLPPTKRSTSRSDGISGIRLYRLPPDCLERSWPTEAGADIELVRFGHRYLVCSPSLHPEGSVYRWLDEDGADVAPPTPQELPELPRAWIDGLTAGRDIWDSFTAPASTSSKAEEKSWLEGLPAGPTCERVAHLTGDALAAVERSRGSAHDGGVKASYALLRAGEEGHRGVKEALELVGSVFVATVTSGESMRRKESEARAEWKSLVLGGVRRVLSKPAEVSGRPCNCQVEEVSPRARRRLKLTSAADIDIRSTEWLWDKRLPYGELSLVAGREGIGKSLVLCDITAQLTRGELEGCLLGTPRDVLLLAVEDSWRATIAPRLMAARADLTRVHRLEVEVGDEEMSRSPILPVDLDLLREAIESTRSALVVIDPLVSALDHGIDSWKDTSVRKALDPLAKVAHETGASVAGLAHLNKAATAETLDKVLGSKAFTQVPRAVHLVARDPDAEDGSCLVVLAKSNLGPLDVPGLRYKVEEARVESRGVEAVTGRLEWLGEVDVEASEVLRSASSEEDRSERDEAAEWLSSFLTERGGEASRGDVVKAARAAGFSDSTLKRARSKAGVKYRRRRERQGPSVWYLDLAPFESAVDSGYSDHSDHLSKADPSEPSRTPRDQVTLDSIELELDLALEDGFGPCSTCGSQTRRYGEGSTGPLCDGCRALVAAPQSQARAELGA